MDVTPGEKLIYLAKRVNRIFGIFEQHKLEGKDTVFQRGTLLRDLRGMEHQIEEIRKKLK